VLKTIFFPLSDLVTRQRQILCRTELQQLNHSVLSEHVLSQVLLCDEFLFVQWLSLVKHLHVPYPRVLQQPTEKTQPVCKYLLHTCELFRVIVMGSVSTREFILGERDTVEELTVLLQKLQVGFV
jgi:hypothetical protein